MTDRSPQENPSPFHRPGWIVSAALLVAALVVGAAVIFWPRSDSPENDPTSPGTVGTTNTVTTEPADPDASICGLEPGDQAVPMNPPEGATWTLHGTFAAPSIEGIGPGLTADDGLAHCFAHSPTGALLAAVNYWAMGAMDPASIGDERLLVDNAAAEALREQLSSGEVSEFPSLQLAGYSFRGTPTATSAVVDLVFAQVGSEAYLLVPMPMVWEGGDWKFELPATGDTGQRSVESIEGYVSWSGTA